MLHVAIMLRRPSRIGLKTRIGLKIHILPDRSDRPAIEHRAVSKRRGAADRGVLRQCKRACQRERGRERNGFKFHGHFLIRKPQQQIADRLLCSAPTRRLTVGHLTRYVDVRSYVRRDLAAGFTPSASFSLRRKCRAVRNAD
jgi:hypothetical protein